MKKIYQKPSILLVKLDNDTDVIATSNDIDYSSINPEGGVAPDAKERSGNPIWD